jgi:hypothetical protein
VSEQDFIIALAGKCFLCGGRTGVPDENLAVVMVDPDGAVRGLVCGDCLVSGRFVQFVATAWLCMSVDDTPTDKAAYEGGDAAS